MEISAALAADLSLLTEALNDRDIDIAANLSALEVTIRRAVSSYLGLAIAIGSDPLLTLTTLHRPLDVPPDAASMSISLPTVPPDSDDPALILTLYARNPGAFVDLTADVGWLATLTPRSALVFDAMPTPLAIANTLTVAQKSSIDQALGVLIGTGYTPDEARRQLSTRAAAAGLEHHLTARLILDEVTVQDDRAV